MSPQGKPGLVSGLGQGKQVEEHTMSSSSVVPVPWQTALHHHATAARPQPSWGPSEFWGSGSSMPAQGLFGPN